MLTTARYLAALGATALLVAGVSACATSRSPSAPSPAKAEPSTLTIATSFSIGDLDPIENGYWGNELGYGELLMRPQPDGTVKPWLLKSLANTSPTTWVLTLNSPIRFQDGKVSWAQFSRAYRRELYIDGPIDKRSRTIKNHGQKFTLRLLKQLARWGRVTLMCHCAEDQRQCHRHVLRRLILSNRV